MYVKPAARACRSAKRSDVSALDRDLRFDCGMTGAGRVANDVDGGCGWRTNRRSKVWLNAVIADVAVPIGILVGLVGIGGFGAVVHAVLDAVLVDVVRIERFACVCRIERTRIAHVALFVAIDVGLFGSVEWSDWIKNGWAVVDAVGDPVAVVVVVCDAVRVFGAPWNAARLGHRHFVVAVEQRVNRFASGPNASKCRRTTNVLRDTGAFVSSAYGQRFTVCAAHARVRDQRVVAIKHLATTNDEHDVFDTSSDDCSMVLAILAVEDGDVSDVPWLEHARDGPGPSGKRAVCRDHTPQLFIREVIVEVQSVEFVGAAQLAKQVHRTRRNPVRSERDRNAERVEERDAGGVAVKIDVRTW